MSSFTDLADTFLKEEFAESPVLASSLGLTAYDEKLDDLSFAPQSRMAREDVLQNDHCFDAVVSAYTAYLWARDGWTTPDGWFGEDGWIYAPPSVG